MRRPLLSLLAAAVLITTAAGATDLAAASSTDLAAASSTDLAAASTTDPAPASTTDPAPASSTDLAAASSTDLTAASTTDPAPASTTDPAPASGRCVIGSGIRSRPDSTTTLDTLVPRNEHSFRRISRNEHSFLRPAGMRGERSARVLARRPAGVARRSAGALARRVARGPGRGRRAGAPLRLRKGAVARQIAPRIRREAPSGPGRLERRVFEGRDIFVYLPPGYRAADRRRYPILILQDGQNLFGEGSSSWQVHRAIDAEVQAGRAEPVIVIGIPARPRHEGRVAEYAVHRDEAEQLGGDGAAYIEFVADRLLPWLRRELPVRPGARDVAIGGSSMGARIAIEAALARPEVFGKVMALSPSVWFNDAEILRRVEGGDPLPASAEIYLDSGGSGRSRDDADRVFRLRDALMARSFQHGSWDAPTQRAARRLWHWFEPGHQHDENAWRERFPRALRVMFPAD